MVAFIVMPSNEMRIGLNKGCTSCSSTSIRQEQLAAIHEVL